MPVPQFKDLGKKAKDLFKKQYDFKNEVKIVNKTGGIKIENGGNACKGLAGYTKANWTDATLGDIEIEGHSTGCTKGQIKLPKMVDGLSLTAAGAAGGDLSLEANYSQCLLSATAKISHNTSKCATGVSLSGVLGQDGISLGGAVDVDASGCPTDYNIGAQYAQKDITAAVVTSKKLQTVSAMVHYKMCCSNALGASAAYNTKSGAASFVVGHDYAIDKSTAFRSKADSEGLVSWALSHTLANPALKVGVSSQYNAFGDNCLKAQKYGISLTFGDY